MFLRRFICLAEVLEIRMQKVTNFLVTCLFLNEMCTDGLAGFISHERSDFLKNSLGLAHICFGMYESVQHSTLRCKDGVCRTGRLLWTACDFCQGGSTDWKFVLGAIMECAACLSVVIAVPTDVSLNALKVYGSQNDTMMLQARHWAILRTNSMRILTTNCVCDGTLSTVYSLY